LCDAHHVPQLLAISGLNRALDLDWQMEGHLVLSMDIRRNKVLDGGA
jgi:hypothetical protein